MLLANTATAKFLSKYNIPALYRVHEGPSEKKLDNLRQFISERGLSLAGGDKPTPDDYQDLFQQIDGREDANIIQTMMLRSMNQAVYQVENKGHFGLAYDAYTHFTSPIRRYPDLLVHRAIRSIIRSNANNNNIKRHENQSALKKSAIYPYDVEALTVLGEQSSMAERRADDATRDVSAWLKCEYLQEHIGEQFTGSIASVAAFGFFVELDDLFVEGLVHVSNLGGDYYQFDAAKQRLIGERTHQVFNLGDKVTVWVEKVELDERKIHLQLSEQLSSAVKPKNSDHRNSKKGKKAAGKKSAKTSQSRRSKKPATNNKNQKKSSKASGKKRRR
jgi:ribonuclease R